MCIWHTKRGNNDVSEGYTQNVGEEDWKVGIRDSLREETQQVLWEYAHSQHVVRPKH